MREPLPRVTISRHPLPATSDTLHISLLSDIHIDSTQCDYDGLRKLMRKRAELPNHVVVLNGDVCDLVMPPDLRRFRQAGQLPEIATADEFFRDAVEIVGDRLEDLGVKFLLIGRGNHEDEALKRHGWDATSVLAARLGCIPAGYSGVHDFRLVRGRSEVLFRMAFHHGAWGGELAKGYPGASRWFSRFDNWHIAVYGHDHKCRVDPEIRLTPDPALGALREREVCFVNCSSWTKILHPNARITHYPERHGYSPQPRKSPLVKVRLVKHRERGACHYAPEYTVEV